VTGADLRAAHGQVRCGRCGTRFDALAALIDESRSETLDEPARTWRAAPAGAPHATSEADGVLDEEPRSLSEQDLARIFVDESDWDAGYAGPPPDREQDSVDPESDILVEEPTRLEEITLEGQRIEISGTYLHLSETDAGRPASLEIVLGEEEDSEDESLPAFGEELILTPEDLDGLVLTFEDLDVPVVAQPEPAPIDVSTALERDSTQLAAAFAVTPAPVVHSAPAADLPRVALSHDHDDDMVESLGEARSQPARRTALFSVASLLLALLLLVQLIHHHRQVLVRHPRFGPAIAAFYAALGMPLSPNWDLAAYEVQQWGVTSDPGNRTTLRLRASITNRAGFAQPYPLLRLSLEDLWGAEVGSRALEPAEYLARGTASDRLMAPQQRTDAEVHIVDPGGDAVGFRVDVCLRESGGLTCADDTRNEH
jgi:Protein of unknown function (DUF3426)